jgi:hypothetical protein
MGWRISTVPDVYPHADLICETLEQVEETPAALFLHFFFHLGRLPLLSFLLYLPFLPSFSTFLFCLPFHPFALDVSRESPRAVALWDRRSLAIILGRFSVLHDLSLPLFFGIYSHPPVCPEWAHFSFFLCDNFSAGLKNPHTRNDAALSHSPSLPLSLYPSIYLSIYLYGHIHLPPILKFLPQIFVSHGGREIIDVSARFQEATRIGN